MALRRRPQYISIAFVYFRTRPASIASCCFVVVQVWFNNSTRQSFGSFEVPFRMNSLITYDTALPLKPRITGQIGRTQPCVEARVPEERIETCNPSSPNHTDTNAVAVGEEGLVTGVA